MSVSEKMDIMWMFDTEDKKIRTKKFLESTLRATVRNRPREEDKSREI